MFCLSISYIADIRLSGDGHSHVCYFHVDNKEGNQSMGTFGGYTRWAVVFLIIFVLFFLLVPGYGGYAGAGVGAGAAAAAPGYGY